MNKVLIATVLIVIGATGTFIVAYSTGLGSIDNSSASSASVATSATNSTGMTTASTGQTSSTTLTASVGSTSSTPKCSTGQDSSSVSSQGLTLVTCVKASARLGDTITLRGIFLNIDAPTTYVSAASLTVTDASGVVVFYASCVPSGLNPVPEGGSYECNAPWNTNSWGNGETPTTGLLHLSVSIAGVSSEMDFSLSG